MRQPETGGSLHLTMEMFKMQTGTDMLHVPYKGSAFTVPELIGGRSTCSSVRFPRCCPM
jgi:tripartite-type tricarboxylate transporter receptor subunit TctC